ncbi:surfeit locus protein 2-like [Hydractinia symbiolongicarpus]|uniref:surfeit locus protein 2-like n=1 Tax=Hydractinia symbiolongicarpus TaxID=13093 RepID=UPI00254FAEF2|nr:surfeit locus protein 2-like [Hydractinia symbiolongicarpus]
MAEEIAIEIDIKQIFNEYEGVFEVLPARKRILCKLTKHEIPLSLDALKDYVEGKKFKRLFAKVKSPKTVAKLDDKYKNYFIPSKNSKSQLYCTLTKKEINNLPHEIEKYITGYKFMKAYHYQKNEQVNIKKTPKNGDTEISVDEDMDDEIEFPSFLNSSDDENDEQEKEIDEDDNNTMKDEEIQPVSEKEEVIISNNDENDKKSRTKKRKLAKKSLSKKSSIPVKKRKAKNL